MFKIICYRVIVLLQVVLVVAAYAVYHFTSTRMGMMRYVVFTNQQWESIYPVSILKYSAITILVIFLVFNLWCCRTVYAKECLQRKMKWMIAVQAFLTMIHILFSIVFYPEKLLPYYFMEMFFTVIVLLQAIKIPIYMKR